MKKLIFFRHQKKKSNEQNYALIILQLIFLKILGLKNHFYIGFHDNF